MALASDDLVLQLFADAGEIGVITGHPHQQVSVILRMLLGISQDVGVDHVYLQGGASIFNITAQEASELLLVLRVADQGRTEGHSMATTVGQDIEIILPIALAVCGLASQHFPN